MVSIHLTGTAGEVRRELGLLLGLPGDGPADPARLAALEADLANARERIGLLEGLEAELDAARLEIKRLQGLPPGTEPPIGPAERQALADQAKRLGLSGAALRDLIHKTFGKQGSADLTARELAELGDLLRREAKVPPRP